MGGGEALASLPCLCRFLSLPSLPCLCFFFLCFLAFLPPPLSGELPRASSSRLTTNLRGMLPGSGLAGSPAAGPCSIASVRTVPASASSPAMAACNPANSGRHTCPGAAGAVCCVRQHAGSAVHTCGGGAAPFACSWGSTVAAVPAGDLRTENRADSIYHNRPQQVSEGTAIAVDASQPQQQRMWTVGRGPCTELGHNNSRLMALESSVPMEALSEVPLTLPSQLPPVVPPDTLGCLIATKQRTGAELEKVLATQSSVHQNLMMGVNLLCSGPNPSPEKEAS